MLEKGKAVGRNAAALKYDFITAVGSWALAQDKHQQRVALRFITLVTARYNWQRDLLCIGQKEIASLWHCNERTVKRDMAKLRAMGWITVRSHGKRGQVARYGVDFEAISQTTRATWGNVGEDFLLRMEKPESGNVVPLSPKTAVPPPQVSSQDEWSVAAALLYQEDPATFGAWLAALEKRSRAGGVITLVAPSRFHAGYVETHLKARMLAACRSVDDTVDDVSICF